ncbi:MAG: bifunctional hydroxymethylpyrimidine kinase/phosphomethylpyrimidine kinase [Phycisphaerales bacterium]
MTPAALTIAGSEPSGGAGLQADLKTFHALGVYGMSAVTLLTVQNTVGVTDVCTLDPAFVTAQIDSVISDIPPACAKTGALGSRAIIEAVAERAAGFAFPLVVDPVMISKHGHALLDADAADAIRDRLLPCAALATPNLHEGAALLGRDAIRPEQMEDAARALLDLGPGAVLLKGGAGARALDVLATRDGVVRLEGTLIESTSTHGSGCALSAACCALLAQGETIDDAASRAKRWVERAIRRAPGLGAGRGPLQRIAPAPAPAGYLRVDAVTLAVRDMAQSVAFYEALGLRIDYGGAEAPFTTLKDGAATINLLRDERRDASAFWGRFILHHENVDAAHERAVRAGLSPREAPHDAPWGERCFHLVDPDGHELAIATPLARDPH